MDEPEEEVAENNFKEPGKDQRLTSDSSEYEPGPRRSSILKKSSDRPVLKSVSFSSIPGEKKVTNGRQYMLPSVLKYGYSLFCFACHSVVVFCEA